MGVLQRWHERADERERSRLDLVGLACEVAVLAALMDEDLAPVNQDRRARALQDSCREHRSAALDLLAPEARHEDLTDDGLRFAIRSFHDRLREVMRLRTRVDRLLLGRADDEWLSTFA